MSQAKLAAGILQSPSVISEMCKGQRLTGVQARERVVQIIDWLRQQTVLTTVAEANALLEAAGMAALHDRDPTEAALLQQLVAVPASSGAGATRGAPAGNPLGARPEQIQPASAQSTVQLSRSNGGHSHHPQSLLTPRTNLPISPFPFIGREEEVVALQQRLATPQCRLLTLVGPGGIGKTRLAIEVAAARRAAYPDGVYFVNLQPTPSAEALPVAIADALHIALASAEPPQHQVQQYLADKALLLVLDNFEHLLDGAPALAELLVAAPDVQLLVTSREVLNLREEWLFWVEGIECPPAVSAIGHPEGSQQALPQPNGENLGSYGAVRLFQEHAQRLQPAFDLARNAAAVVRICQLSGGMPLALELAASWVKSLPCAEIAEELASGLTILSTPLRNIPERHRTMRVVFEQSWKRLSEHEQEAFQRLSVFRGGFRREATQQVAGATLPVLSLLVDRCLLKQEADGRYQIHELLRQYGEERLAESPIVETATHESYSAYFVAFLSERRFEFDGRGQLQAIQEIAEELENIRGAWGWAISHLRAEVILPALRSLLDFYQHRSRYLEGVETFADTIHHLESRELQEGGAALAECLTYFALHCIRLGRLTEANTAAVRALHLFDTLGIFSQYRAGDPIMTLLLLALVQGDYDQALTLGEQARHQAEQHNQPAALSFACYGLANALLAQGKFTQARTYAEQGLILSNSLENRWFSSFIHEVLGQIASTQEELQAAKGHFEIAYAIREEFDEPGGMAETLIHLGEVAIAENEPGVAQQHYERSLALYWEINDRGGRAAASKGLGDVARSQGHYLIAETYYQQALQSALEMRYMPLVFNLLLASANLFLQTDRRQSAVELLAFVHQHPASNHTSKEQAYQALEYLDEYPTPPLQEITWQAAPPQWAVLLRSM